MLSIADEEIEEHILHAAPRTRLPSWVDASKKYFLGGGLSFSAPPERPARAKVRDHIKLQEGDHRASYMSRRGLQLRKQLKTDFREILRAAQFSTFSTASVIRRQIKHAWSRQQDLQSRRSRFDRRAGCDVGFHGLTMERLVRTIFRWRRSVPNGAGGKRWRSQVLVAMCCTSALVRRSRSAFQP